MCEACHATLLFCCHGNLMFGLVGGSMRLTAARLVVLLEECYFLNASGNLDDPLNQCTHTNTHWEGIAHHTWMNLPPFALQMSEVWIAPNHHSKVANMSSLGDVFSGRVEVHFMLPFWIFPGHCRRKTDSQNALGLRTPTSRLLLCLTPTVSVLVKALPLTVLLCLMF